ncbi:hypothetical protein J4411_00810 [Candidatus Pacearchaeota archaeon]|nr:hypothetical protein [uncultured archaeon]MBS3084436.1 hypothetical protein [Candidatus Pacearchaeota archaeon]
MGIKEDNLKKIFEIMKTLPVFWNGKKSILEMKENNFDQWKQMEWIGFYFEFLCEKYLKGFMEFHKIKYGNTSFDGFLEIPFDFKSHAINTESHRVIINDTEATIKAIEEYGFVIVIMALGEVTYNDVNRTFQKWHEKIKGGKSKYEEERIKRGALSRLRKTEFNLKELRFIKINKGTLERCGSFQKNFRNADGSLRRSKVLLDLEKLKDEEVIKRMKF